MPVTPQGEIIDPSAGDASNQLDCVICHGTTYDGGGKDGNREVLVDDNGKTVTGVLPVWKMLRPSVAR